MHKAIILFCKHTYAASIAVYISTMYMQYLTKERMEALDVRGTCMTQVTTHRNCCGRGFLLDALKGEVVQMNVLYDPTQCNEKNEMPLRRSVDKEIRTKCR